MELNVAYSQLESYLKASKIKYGILYYFPIDTDDENTIWFSSGKMVRSIYPMDKAIYLGLEEEAIRYSSLDGDE